MVDQNSASEPAQPPQYPSSSAPEPGLVSGRSGTDFSGSSENSLSQGSFGSSSGLLGTRPRAAPPPKTGWRGFIQKLFPSDSDVPTPPQGAPISNPQARAYQDGEDGLRGSPSTTREEGQIALEDEQVRRSFALRWMLVIWTWIKGPVPPEQLQLRPFFPKIQAWPQDTLNRLLPGQKRKALLGLLFYGLWIGLFAYCASQIYSKIEIEGYGKVTPVRCSDSFWQPRNGCGEDGRYCKPFDKHTLAFQCPATCSNQILYQKQAVGDTEIQYKRLVVGGGDYNDTSSAPYRADSSLCVSAIHAGYVSNMRGGCGVVEFVGEYTDFPSSERNGIESLEFRSTFPKSFRFVPGLKMDCADRRWNALPLSIIFTVLTSIFVSDSALFFFSILFGLFLHVSLISDPPGTVVGELVSLMFGRLLPTVFIGYVVWRWPVRSQMRGDFGRVSALDRAVLWLGPAWVGALNNLTFDRLPISRLTPHDLRSQPGAIVALVLLSIVALALGIYQIFCFQREGQLIRFIRLYLIIGLGLLVMSLVPGLNLRVHHYILALLLLPGTGTQTRVSMICQGLLFGLFIHGTARWGYASILETDQHLLGTEAIDTPLPEILANYPKINFDSDMNPRNITFEWSPASSITQTGDKVWFFDGVSILVNDVERANIEDDGTPEASRFTWERKHDGFPDYFRFAFVNGRYTGSYTYAGTWTEDGKWIEMKPGKSFT